jgi:hypothetical protein
LHNFSYVNNLIFFAREIYFFILVLDASLHDSGSYQPFTHPAPCTPAVYLAFIEHWAIEPDFNSHILIFPEDIRLDEKAGLS